jgi:hypothetical protein
MRTEIELWTIVLKRKDCFLGSLCSWLAYTSLEEKFSKEEVLLCNKAIRNSSKKSTNCTTWYWIGDYGDIELRIKWIKERINEIENDRTSQKTSL